MATVETMLRHLGRSVLKLVSATGGLENEATEVVVFDREETPRYPNGCVVLGVGVRPGADALQLATTAHTAGAAALVLRPRCVDETLVDFCRHSNLALLTPRPGADWVAIVSLLRHALSRSQVEDIDATQLGSWQGVDLFTIANVVADMIDAPVTIEDNSLQVLAFSDRQENTDEGRVKTIVARRVVPEERIRMGKLGYLRRIAESKVPIYMPAWPGRKPRVVMAVRSGDELLGSIWGVVEDKLPPEKEHALQEAAGIVGLHMLRQRFSAMFSGDLESQLVEHLLQGGPEAAAAGRQLGLRRSAYRVLAIGLIGVPSGDAGLALPSCRDLLSLHLSPLTTHLATVAVGSTLYCIVPGTQNTSALRNQLQSFVARAERRLRCQIHIALGPAVHEPDDLHLSRLGADRALRVLRTGASSRIAELDEVQASAVVLEFVASHVDDPTLIGGPLLKLKSADDRERTDYIPTLRAYLENMGNTEAAAAELGVHRNTIRYRLRSMGSIVELHLDDPVQRLGLMLQLYLMEDGGSAPGRMNRGGA